MAKGKSKSSKVVRKVKAELVDDQKRPKIQSLAEGESEAESFEPVDDELVNEVPLEVSEPEKISSNLPAIESTSLTTTDPITAYMAEIRKYPLLTKEQEFELAKKYFDTKDPKLAQVLVTSNLRFVVKVAAEYSKFGARLIDLVQEGNMGLMHAVKDFNPYKGVRLITYAVWWIRGYIQEYLMKQYSLVKIGTTQNQKKLFYRLQKEKELLENMGQSGNLQLLSEKMGIPEDEVKMMAQRMSGRDISLSQPLDSENKSSLLDLQSGSVESPDEIVALKENIENLKSALEELRPELSDREKIILDERLLNDDPLTLQEIGDKYKITREAVRQMEVRVMKKIKDKFTNAED